MFGCHVDTACGPSEHCGWKLSFPLLGAGRPRGRAFRLRKDRAGQQTQPADGRGAGRRDMEMGVDHRVLINNGSVYKATGVGRHLPNRDF